MLDGLRYGLPVIDLSDDIGTGLDLLDIGGGLSVEILDSLYTNLP